MKFIKSLLKETPTIGHPFGGQTIDPQTLINYPVSDDTNTDVVYIRKKLYSLLQGYPEILEDILSAPTLQDAIAIIKLYICYIPELYDFPKESLLIAAEQFAENYWRSR